MMSLFWLTLVVRNFFGIGIPVVVFLVYALAISFLGKRNEMISLAVSCIPLSTSIQYKYIILIIIAVYVVKYFKELGHMQAWALFGVLIMFWELLHFGTLGFSIVEYLRSFAELLFCMLIFATSYRDYDFSLIRTTLAISTIVVIGVVFLNILKEGISLDEAFSGYYRFGKYDGASESFAGQFNPNGLGFICNLSIAGLLQEIYYKKRPVVNWIMIAFLTLFGTLTLSRSFLVCFAVIILLFTWCKVHQSNKKKNLFRSVGILLAVAAAMAGAFFLFTKLFPSAYAQFLNRMNADDITNGRIELLSFFNKHIFSSFENAMFGIGMQNVPEKIDALYGRQVVPHNGIQETLLIWGIPGLVMVVAWFWSFIHGAKLHNKNRLTLMNLLPLVFFILENQSGQFFRSGKSLLAILFAFISLCQTTDGETPSNDPQKTSNEESIL